MVEVVNLGIALFFAFLGLGLFFYLLGKGFEKVKILRDGEDEYENRD